MEDLAAVTGILVVSSPEHRVKATQVETLKVLPTMVLAVAVVQVQRVGPEPQLLAEQVEMGPTGSLLELFMLAAAAAALFQEMAGQEELAAAETVEQRLVLMALAQALQTEVAVEVEDLEALAMEALEAVEL
jgi:hypothetical protein